MIVPYAPAYPANLDSRSLKFRAVVDWIEFEIVTVRPTQFPHVQGHLEEVLPSTPYVTPIEPETGKRKVRHGGTTTAFRFRVYDHYANTYEATHELFAHLRERFQLAEVPRITGLEVSLDAYCLDDDKIKEAVLWMMAHLSTPGVNVRQYKMKPLIDGLSSVQLDPMRSLYINNEDDPLTYRVYLKRTDGNRDDVGKQLPREQWRARTEFTLAQSKLEEHGLRTLDDLASVDFGKLGSEYLRFANIKSLEQVIAAKDALRAAGVRAMWDERAVCLAGGWGRQNRGQDGYRKHAKPTRLKNSRYTTMNEEANRIVTREFRNLGRCYLHISD